MRNIFTRHAIVTAAVLLLMSVASSQDVEARNYIFNYGKKLANGKTCRVVFGETHMHAANGARPGKAAAEVKAIKDWASFVVFEYGRRWGNWSHADKKSMTCMNDKDAGVWRCRADGQPCL